MQQRTLVFKQPIVRDPTNTLGVFFSTMIAVLVASLPKPMPMGMRLVIAGIIAVITVLIFIVGLNMTISMFPEF